MIHPQSVIHSLVEYVDGSVLAQLGNPDMRMPIAQRWRGRSALSPVSSALDLIARRALDFQAPDFRAFSLSARRHRSRAARWHCAGDAECGQ